MPAPVTIPSIGNTWTPLNVPLDAYAELGSGSQPVGLGSAKMLVAFLIPSALSVLAYGAKGDGTTDDTTACQATITACPAGGSVLFPPGYTFKLTGALTSSGKNITILLLGKVLDRIASWTNVLNDLTLTGKGTFAFKDCEISVLGLGRYNFDGGKGVGGVDQSQRNSFYFENCSDILIQGMSTKLSLGYAIGTFACTNVRHLDCIHYDGWAPVVHRSSSQVFVNNVATYNGKSGGIVIINRGFLTAGALAETRPAHVIVSNCYVYGTTFLNGDAVGLTIDATDYFTLTGCLIDNASLGTMGVSLADSTQGTVVGNLIKNVDNLVAPGGGAYAYCGIGMECVRIADCQLAGNNFVECVCGYQVSATSNCSFDGSYKYTYGSTHSASTGAVVAAYINLGGSVGTPDDNVRISGNCFGGNLAVYVAGYATRVRIHNLHIKSPFNSFLSCAAAGTAGLTMIQISDCSYFNATSGNVIIFPINVAANVVVTGFVSEGTAVGAGKVFLTFAGDPGKLLVTDCKVINSETLFDFNAGLTRTVTIRSNQVSGATTFVNNAGNIYDACIEANTNGIDPEKPAGKNATIRYGYAVPFPGNNATFIGQLWVDDNSGSKKVYMAVAKGSATPADDWVALN